MGRTDIEAITRAVPLVVRELGADYDPWDLIEVTGRLAADMETMASTAQVRTRLAAAAGAYLSWLYPPAGFALRQAAFGRLWWDGPGISVLDVIVIGADVDALTAEAERSGAAGLTVRLAFVEAPAHTRTLAGGEWRDGWGWPA